MSWSNDGRYVCFSDSSKKIIIMSITASAGSLDPVVETKAEVPMKNSTNGPVLQLLFHPDSSQLLVRSSSTVCIISLISFSMKSSLKLDTAECKWITHPQDPGLIVGVGPNAIYIQDWTLRERQIYKYEHPRYQSMPLNLESFLDRNTVDRVLVTHDKKHVLVQLSPLNQNSKEKTFLYFETSSWSTTTAAISGIDQETGTIAITPFILPLSLSSKIAFALSLLSNDKFIFLSRTHSICSWRHPFRSGPSLSSPPPTSHPENIATATTVSAALPDHHYNNNIAEDKAEPLFSLPGDWISRDCLALCSIWRVERSLLCPRNGEVAAVRCAALT